jgi:thiol-disulfide isomerase/thioredoxin
MRYFLSILSFCVAIVMVATSAAESPYRLRIGDHAPDIELTRLEGGQLRLSGVNRQSLAVSFYSPYCEPCQRELPVLSRVVARVAHDTGSDVRLAVIVTEGPPDTSLISKLGPSVIWFLDDHEKAKAAFDPRTLPCTFIFGTNDVVRHINRGFGPKYEARVEGWLRRLVSHKKR